VWCCGGRLADEKRKKWERKSGKVRGRER